MTYQIERARFHLAEHYQQQYVAVVPKDTKPEDLEDPMFFSGVSNLCRASGRIFVECEDGTWVADLYIKAVGLNMVMVRTLSVWDLSEYQPPQRGSADQQSASPAAVVASAGPKGYHVEWAGNHHKWRVVRDMDSAVIHKGEPSKEQATAWLNEHLKAVAR